MHFPRKGFPSSVAIGLGLTLWLGVRVAPAQADYQPPEGEIPLELTVSNGPRDGCLATTALPFMAIAPVSHLGYSATPQPTFFFYVPLREAYHLDVDILDAKSTFVEALEATGDQPGLVPVTLTTALPPGIYTLQVALVCESGHDSGHGKHDAEFGTTFRQTEATQALTPAGSPEKGTIAPDPALSSAYADQGYWYDAFSLADERQRPLLIQQLAQFEAEPRRSQLQDLATHLTTELGEQEEQSDDL